jgi:HlyD family secretion protein
MSSSGADAPDLSRLRIERAAPAPRRRSLVLPVIAVLLLAGAGFAAWKGGWLDGRPRVEIGRVTRVAGAAAVSGTAANGYVVARREAALSTDIAGRIVDLKVEEGMRVKAGDLIAKLDTRELEAARERTKADLATAQTSAEWARLDFQRKAPLLGSGDVSQSVVDQARIEKDRAEAQVNALQSALDQIEVQISKSSVYAPFDGVITRKNAEVGEVVSSISAGANSRGSVATLVDFDTLEVQIELAQTSLKAAREGAPVLIYLDAFPDQGYRGRVRQIWPTADRQKATVELRAEFLERDEHILPEMGVRVVFTGDDQVAATAPEVLVPERAVLRAGDLAAVFVLDGEHVERRDIQVDPPERGNARVTSGLQGGETVVLDPPASLRDGQAVRLAEKP